MIGIVHVNGIHRREILHPRKLLRSLFVGQRPAFDIPDPVRIGGIFPVGQILLFLLRILKLLFRNLFSFLYAARIVIRCFGCSGRNAAPVFLIRRVRLPAEDFCIIEGSFFFI